MAIQSLGSVAFWYPAAVAAFTSALATFAVRALALRFELFGTTRRHHTHASPVPRLGGIGVYLGVIAACFSGKAFNGSPGFVLPVLAGSIPVLLVGLYDDLRHASPGTKIAAQALGAALLIALDFHFHRPLQWAVLVVTPVWLMVTANAFNVIDGVDGLAASTGVIIAVGLTLLNVMFGNPALAMLSLAIGGALLGFMPFNFVRRGIFLGDCGSLSAGFLLGAIALRTPVPSPNRLIYALLFGYPLAEAALTVTRRILERRKLFRPDRDHMHHRLRHAGFTPTATIAVLSVIAVAYVGLALATALGVWPWAAAVGAVLAWLFIAHAFGYTRPRDSQTLRRVNASQSREVEVHRTSEE